MLLVESYAIELIGVDARVGFGDERAADGELGGKTNDRDGYAVGCAAGYGSVDVGWIG